jgi:hypothetical protein
MTEQSVQLLTPDNQKVLLLHTPLALTLEI